MTSNPLPPPASKRSEPAERTDSALADDLLHLLRRVLRDDVLGVSQHGSAVLAGLRRTSDFDVLVVTRRPMTAAAREALLDGLLPISGPRARAGPRRPVELTVVVQSDVRPWRYPPRCDFMYGDLWVRGEGERPLPLV